MKLLVENLQALNQEAFMTDDILTKELMKSDAGSKCVLEPIGVVLISPKNTCRLCGTKLLLRGDCPSRVILYTDTLDTVPATHYHKLCPNKRK